MEVEFDAAVVDGHLAAFARVFDVGNALAEEGREMLRRKKQEGKWGK